MGGFSVVRRTELGDRINAKKKLEDDLWIVTTTHTSHNHELLPSMSILLHAHRNLNVHLRK
ncbi:hypothetical protein ACS0TY_021105 [Phlomoides rotata]